LPRRNGGTEKHTGAVHKRGSKTCRTRRIYKRAFLNGRIDLSQAEAVIDLINSKTNESSKAAISQLEENYPAKLKMQEAN